jgi:phosphohistidine phosphatase
MLHFAAFAFGGGECNFHRMNIYILRHGIAVERDEWESKNDAERALTAEGKKQLRKTCRAMEKMKLDFNLILSSPYMRARRTAEIVADKLNLKKRLKFSGELQPDGNAKNFFRQLNNLKPAPESILLVGHEPYLSRTISLLISGNENAAVDFKKGGLCKLEVGKLRTGKCATLAWLLTPKQMKLMR